YFLFFLIFIFSVSLLAENITLENDILTLNISIENKIPVADILRDNKTGTDFITDCDYSKSLWRIDLKKDMDYDGEIISLFPENSENINIEKTDSKAQITWFNVKSADMEKGFDVTATITLDKENTYWHIKIKSHTNQYGICQVSYPIIGSLNTENTETMFPFRGGRVWKDYTEDMQFPTPAYMQLVSFTKKGSTLYFSPEDKDSYTKWTIFTSNPQKNMFFENRTECEYYAEAGHDYNQSYNYNIAVLEGDWYTAAKKYRAWGLKNNYGVFALGKIEDRKDLPDWFKTNPVWLHWDANFPEDRVESLLESKEILGVPCASHVYLASKYHMDSHYPNILPVIDTFKADCERVQKAGIKVMPYTNGFLVDTVQAPAYKEYGDILTVKNTKGEIHYESTWDIAGAKNAVACIGSPYSKILTDEYINIERETNVDAIYMDQVGASPRYLCFDKNHNHNMGGGTFWVKLRNDQLKEMREKLYRQKGEYVPICTENSHDAFAFDMWLRCSDGWGEAVDTPVNTVVYSGYGTSIGDTYFQKELEENDSISAINKMATDFTKGIQPGWSVGSKHQLKNNPKFGEFFGKVAKARYRAIEFFNLGEMVRPVTITSENPIRNLMWITGWGEFYFDFPMIRTCSFEHKGKACIAFVNVSEDKQTVSWKTLPENLNIKKKSSYTLSEIFPNEKKEKITSLKGTLQIEPQSVKIFVIE
ncbi:MAG: hypothetical protein KBT47_06685, partial [Armatimonadetes bacterium]|nr:hypothetical protein [Candidatus Hippobium faecium]